MFDPRTEVTNTNDKYWGPMNYGAKAKKAAQNYESYRNWNGGGLQFRPTDHKMEEEEEEESGVCSPPLWSTSPANPVHPPRLPGQSNSYRYLSPTSRTQAIARGQWELMEMVKNMPESSYELSLKDLVEHPRLVGNSTIEESNTATATNSMVDQEQTFISSGPTMNQRVKSKKNVEKKAKMMTSIGSIDNNRGLFLKTVFPISFRSSPKKRKNQGTNPMARVAPKPLEASMEKSSSSKSCVEKDWWKKKISGSGGSESGVTSSSNGGSTSSSTSSSRSNSGRKKSGCLRVCWSPFHSH